MSKRSVQVPVDQERSQKKRAEKTPKTSNASKTAKKSTPTRGAGSATYEREEKVTAEAQPSRKSSRRSANHQKAAPTLKARQELRLAAPTSRHDRGS